MRFNRRAFIQLMSAFVADPERLLWVPGQKKIFIPPDYLPVFDPVTLAAYWNGKVVELFYYDYPFARALKASRLKQRDANDTLLTSANAIGWNGF